MKRILKSLLPIIAVLVFLTACSGLGVRGKTEAENEKNYSLTRNDVETTTKKALPKSQTENRSSKKASPIFQTGDFRCFQSASSVLAPQTVSGVTYSYEAKNLCDNDPNTCWAEGADGAGIGESFTVECFEEVTMSGLIISNGYCKSQKLFELNNRLKDITIVFDDGSQMRTTLKDGFENRKAVVDFGRDVTTKTVTVIIESVYNGDDYNDTCVSEVEYYTFEAVG